MRVSDDTNLWEWQLFADNIYNEEPANATDTITTTISTVPVYWSLYRQVGSEKFYGYFPLVQQSKFKSFGYRTLFYYGLVADQKEDWSAGTAQYPLASPLHILPDNTTYEWSNVYRHPKQGGGPYEVDYGIIRYWWQSFLDFFLKPGETVQANIRLPLIDLVNFKWSDQVIIQNILYLVKSIIEPIPYTGFVQATLKRINLVPVPPAVPALPAIFVRLTLQNIVNQGDVSIYTDYTVVDVRVQLFEDIGGTIPYTPGVPVVLVVTNATKINTIPQGSFNSNVNVSAADQIIFPATFYSGRDLNTDILTEMDYFLQPDPNGIYTVI
jgi:hypothetical protein